MPAGPAYDAAYLRFQIAHHENEHEVLSRNQGNTRDNDFDDLIDDWLEDLKERRNQAVMIVSGMP